MRPVARALPANSPAKKEAEMMYKGLLFSGLLMLVAIVSVGESLSWKLACLEAGEYVAEDGVEARRMLSLLNGLSAHTSESKKEIADITPYAVETLAEKGLSASYADIMKGAFDTFSESAAERDSKNEYRVFVAAYITMRAAGVAIVIPANSKSYRDRPKLNSG